MKKRQIITIILALAALTASAQGLVFGTVQDAFLKTPITDAKVSLLLAADSTVVIDSIPITVKRRDDGTVREAQFMLQPEKKIVNICYEAGSKAMRTATCP